MYKSVNRLGGGVSGSKHSNEKYLQDTEAA